MGIIGQLVSFGEIASFNARSYLCRSTAGIKSATVARVLWVDRRATSHHLVVVWHTAQGWDAFSCFFKVAEGLQSNIITPKLQQITVTRGCYNCVQPEHFARDCPQLQKCFTCSARGHTSAECPVITCDHAICPTQKSGSESESWLRKSSRQFMFQDTGDDTMLVPVGINDTRISAIVDTVVQLTVIINPETHLNLGLVESSSSEVVQLRSRNTILTLLRWTSMTLSF